MLPFLKIQDFFIYMEQVRMYVWNAYSPFAPAVFF